MNFFFQNFALGLLNKVFVLLIIICDGFGSMGVEGRKSKVIFDVSLNHLQRSMIQFGKSPGKSQGAGIHYHYILCFDMSEIDGITRFRMNMFMTEVLQSLLFSFGTSVSYMASSEMFYVYLKHMKFHI